jgi:hypothetical protein
MIEEGKAEKEWYQKAIRALESAISAHGCDLDEDEVPPTEESIAGAIDYLNEASEKLCGVSIPKFSISTNGTINLRWRVSDGRIDVSFNDGSMQAFVSTKAEHKAIERSEVAGRVLALVS